MVMEQEVLMSLQSGYIFYLAAGLLKLRWLRLAQAHFEQCTCMFQNPSDWPLRSAANWKVHTFEGHLVTTGKMGKWKGWGGSQNTQLFLYRLRKGDPYLTFVILVKFIKAYNQERPKCPKSWSYKHLQLDINIPIKLLALFKNCVIDTLMDFNVVSLAKIFNKLTHGMRWLDFYEWHVEICRACRVLWLQMCGPTCKSRL